MLSPTMQFLMPVDKQDQKVVLESSAFIVWACRIYDCMDIQYGRFLNCQIYFIYSIVNHTARYQGCLLS